MNTQSQNQSLQIISNYLKGNEDRYWKLAVIGGGIGVFLSSLFLFYKRFSSKKIMTVRELYIYPIKSCAGIPLTSATLDEYGFQHDRRWVIVNENGEFLTQRKYPKLAVVKTAIDDHFLRISAEGKEELKIELQLANDAKLHSAIVWKEEGLGYDEGEEAAAWFSSYLNIPSLRLVRRFDEKHTRKYSPETLKNNKELINELPNKISYVDEHPILLISRASLRALNRRLRDDGKDDVPMSRFRANIIVDDENECPRNFGCILYRGISFLFGARSSKEHVEDTWRGIQIGDLQLFSADDKYRCVMTTIDQETGCRQPRQIAHDEQSSKTDYASLKKYQNNIPETDVIESSESHQNNDETNLVKNVNYLEPLITLRKYRLGEQANSPRFGQAFVHPSRFIASSISLHQPITVVEYK